MSDAPRLLRLRISGRVQGVGYRAFLTREAARLGVHGWVRNRLDGSVEALARGPAEALNALVAAAKRGPGGSRVDAVRIEPADDAALGDAGGESLIIAPTA
jgi:acylphosphatase